MTKNNLGTEYTQFVPQINLIYARGYIMLIVGTLISIGSIISSDVGMLSSTNSWIPIASLVLILIGLLGAFDTYISRHTSSFLVNLQISILDTVFGLVLFFGLSYSSANLSILIATFVIIKGLFRVISGYMGELFDSKSTMVGGAVSLLFGVIIWGQWPFEGSTMFLSFCLSVEIALRGWASIQFAKYLRSLKV